MVWQENEHPRDNNGQFTSKGGNTNARPNEAKLRNYGIDTREMAKQYIGNDKLQALADKLDVSIDDLSEDELLKYMSDDEIADMMRINGVDFDDDYESDFESWGEEQEGFDEEEFDTSESVEEYTRQELIDKFGTDNLDIINAGNEKTIKLKENSDNEAFDNFLKKHNISDDDKLELVRIVERMNKKIN